MRSTDVYAACVCESLTSTPSSVTVCWSARAPLVAPLRGSLATAFGMKTAPGSRLRSWTTLRASIGRLLICCSLMELPRLASTVLRRGVSANTVTASESCPTSSFTSCRMGVSTRSSIFSYFADLKPLISIRSSYMPGGSAEN